MINHLWIIMDWNRRWAKKRFFPSIAWHKAWANNAIRITKLASNKGIKYITLWALSTDNLKKRDTDEVSGIIKLINNIENYLWDMIHDGLRFETIWNLSELPEQSQKILNSVREKTKENTWITLILALVYGGQDEIVRAAKKIVASWLEPEKITKEEFRKYTDTGKFPTVDIIVRAGWDNRHSWFLLFDSEYTEYHFTEKMWPDYDEDELDKTIEIFDKANRRFWK
jgi:undecaprenyl diphosphate synthase